MKYSSRALMSTTFLALALLCGTSEFAYANPMDGVVTSGQATISLSGKKLDITQQSNRAVIDWRGFDIAPDEHTQFYQPDSKSIAINRVNSTNASKIDGKLTANGNVVIINQNGVLFGQNAKVDVNGLIATTADIDNAKAMADSKLVFDKKGNPQGAIINKGQITAKEAGLVGFVAPNVINDGIITANLGRVHLASGDTATVDLYGDGLMSVAVSDDVKSQLVSNTGAIDAGGGKIALTAAAGKTIVNSLINVQGSLKAQSVQSKNGEIIISAGKAATTGSSNVIVQAKLDASGRDKGESGGKITITGDNVALLSGTVIDASGYEGKSGTTAGKEKSAYREGSAGGDIRIGGDYLGQGDTPTAKNLYVDSGVLVLNDALYSGDAGRTIFWSDDTTKFYGNVYARALGGKAVDALTWNATTGGNKGDGGFVETSGHGQLDAGGYVDLTSSGGARGTYFLDPTNITIYGNFNPNYTSTDGSLDLANNLVLWLDAADTDQVRLTYSLDSLNGATVTGNAGDDFITTSADVSNNLTVGARIRFGASGTPELVSTLGDDTYTITAINGTTITLSTALTSSYGGSTLYRGLVSSWIDKSSAGNTATQASENFMPLWTEAGFNGRSAIKFDGYNDGNGDYLRTSDFSVSDFSFFTGIINNEPNVGGGISYGSILVESGNKGIFSYGPGFQYYPTLLFDTPLTQGIPSLAAVISEASYSTGYINNQMTDTLATPVGSTFRYIGGYGSVNDNFDGTIAEMIVYNTALSNADKGLIDQYQSMKLGMSLIPPGSGMTEAAKAMASTARGDAVDGYSAFTTRYLEHLSQSADISLQASNNINLDLQGDTLQLAANRNITLTAGHDITSNSAGTVATTGTGDITFVAGNDVLLSGLNTQTENGDILLKAGNNIAFTNGNRASTTGGNIVLNSDSDANQAGAVYLGHSTGLVALGAGNITVGGGADPLTTAAYGTSGYVNGIELSTAYIVTEDGDVTLNGNSSTDSGMFFYGSAIGTDGGNINLTGTGNVGVNVNASVNIVTATGDITVKGTGNNTDYATGVYFYRGGNLASTGTGITAGKIDVTGTSTGTGISHTGILFDREGNLQSVDGNISLTGTSNNGAGVAFPEGEITTTGSAQVKITAINTSSGNDIALAGAFGGAQATGDYIFNVNSLNHYVDPFTLQTAGNVTVRPRTASTTIGINGGAGGLNVTSAFLAGLTANKLIIGRDDSTGQMTLAAGDWSGYGYNLDLLSGAAKIKFDGNQVMGANYLLAKTTSGDIELSSGSKITSTATGDAIVLASGHNFINNAGVANALSVTGSGRWLVYSDRPSNNVTGVLNSSFNRYSCTYGGLCPTLGMGNGLLYRYTPVLTATASGIQLPKGSAVPSLSSYAYQISGYLGNDGASDVVSGALNGNTNYTQNSNTGNYAIAYANGTLASAMGYGFAYTDNPAGITVVSNAPSVPDKLPNTVVMVAQGTALNTSNEARSSNEYDNYSGLFGAGQTSSSNRENHEMLEVDPVLARYLGL